jgi:2TM domain
MKNNKTSAEAIKTDLYINLFVYVVINTGLFAINYFTKGENGVWWFYWPLIGWGIGLMTSTFATYIRNK